MTAHGTRGGSGDGDVPALADAVGQARGLRERLRDTQETVVRALEREGSDLIQGNGHPANRELHDWLGASGFNLSFWWAMTPTDWTCPGCGREKAQIARLDRSGRLLGKLVEHHDHMGAVLERTFQEVSGRQREVVAGEGAEAFAKRMAPGIAAYDPVVICQDCNNADPKAKKLAGAPDDFSFPIQDIARFVCVRDNAPLGIDPDAAREAWADARPAHEARMQVIQQLAEIAARDDHWFRPAPPHADAGRMTHFARLDVAYPLGLAALSELPPALWAATGSDTSTAGADGWRRKRRPSGRVPTAGEIQTVARVTHAGPWARLPDDWVCPVCERSKQACVRQSSNKSSANTFTFKTAPAPFSDVSGKLTVCDCCRQDAIALEHEAGAARGCVSTRQLRAVIRPADHQRHGIDQAAADRVVKELRAAG
jgi:rubredoxin